MTNLYDVLGLTTAASKDDIRKAYRRLAKQSHPDLFPDDKEAEARFKDITAAHDILSDDEKRRQYDAGEIDDEGHERPPRHYYREYAGGGPAGPGGGGQYNMSEEDLGNIFAEMFGDGMDGGAGDGGQFRRAAGGAGRSFKAKGQDITYTLAVEFLEAANGATKRVTMADGKTLDITIPRSASDRQMLRLKGQGMPGFGGGPSGDAYIELHVRPHPVFTRKDDNIHIELPISLPEAVLGGKVAVPTIDGNVTMTIAPGANAGDSLRLKGKGLVSGGPGATGSVRRGDQYVRLKIVLPDAPDAELSTFLKDWAESHSYDPREAMSKTMGHKSSTGGQP